MKPRQGGAPRYCSTAVFPISRVSSPWKAIYAADQERIQDWDEAVVSDAAVSAVWRRYGYDLTDLPLAPVEERLAFVLGALAV